MSPTFPLPYRLLRLSFVSKHQEQADWAGLTNAWSHDVKYGLITIPCHALVFPRTSSVALLQTSPQCS